MAVEFGFLYKSLRIYFPRRYKHHLLNLTDFIYGFYSTLFTLQLTLPIFVVICYSMLHALIADIHRLFIVIHRRLMFFEDLLCLQCAVSLIISQTKATILVKVLDP